ncbi:hypothetical protein ACFQRL_06705 [Microbacterium fluvii]|uniref:Transcriptional regulator, AbiEi antitoxin, Type IV TA system n=1 Tax=Microbacterium fluvii TaxID=415215 RepID=A0ABW2HDX1_9MICO|nr:hypothetical protein [Microbacterium fluvii]MCU4672275.1 hypothetical protein [Microbacterium fluvii]
MPVLTASTTIRQSPVLLITARDRALREVLPKGAPVVRVCRGVVAPKREWEALRPWERYLARVHAVALTHPGVVFTLESAAALLGMPLFGEPRHVHVLAVTGKSRQFDGVVVHSSKGQPDLIELDGHVLTSVAQTTVDLCRVLPPAFALATADVLLRAAAAAGEATIDLRKHARATANRRGLRQVDWVAARASAAAESPGESVSRAVIEWLGYEEPEPQEVFHFEDVEDRVDFFFRRVRVAGESDGYGKYDADDAEASKQHFVDEKRREDRLRRHLGGFARWDWADAMRFEPLDRALRSAGLSPLYPRHAAMLATLKSNPRSLPPVASSRRPPGER